MIGKKAILVLTDGREVEGIVLELDGDIATLGVKREGNKVYRRVSRDDEGARMTWRPPSE